MTFSWKPAIWKGGSLTLLPRPVTALRPHDTWDMRDSKVPLKDGSVTTGHSFNAVEIEIAGKMAIQSSVANLPEQEMFTHYESLRNLLNINDDSQKYEFFIYHDAGSGIYRKYKSCSCRDLALGFGDDDRVVFTYQATIIADDPVVYSTSPGV